MTSHDSMMIHEILKSGSMPISDIIDLTNRFPEMLQIKDENGEIPLHIVSRSSVKYTPLIELFASIYHEGLLIPNNQSNSLPIHLAIENESVSADIVLFLAKRCPESLLMTTNLGYLPLHCACQWTRHSDIIPTLISMYPESLKIKTQSNRLPIHLSCGNNTFSDMAIEYMASKYIDGLLVDEPFPLHIVLVLRSLDRQLGVVRIIARICPDAIFINGLYGSALNIAYRRGNKLVYRVLLNALPSRILEATHLLNYFDLNWLAREPSIKLLHSIEKTQVKKNHHEYSCKRMRVLYSIAKNSWSDRLGQDHAVLCNILSYL